MTPKFQAYVGMARGTSGLHIGGRVFGYRRVPIESATQRDSHGRPVIDGVKLEVEPAEAATVRRIFERYAAGDSMKRIALDLNDAGIASPQPRKGEFRGAGAPLRSSTFCTTSVTAVW